MPLRRTITTRQRVSVALLCGVIVAAVLVVTGQAAYAPLVGWDTAALLYVASALLTVLRFNAAETRTHARQESPGRATADALLLVTSLASIAAVVILVFLAGDAHGAKKVLDVVLGLVSIICSWGVVHTLFLLNYARLYYGDPEGGVSFPGSAKPRYSDFAYLAFTVGMTFQVSDTDLQTRPIRQTVLKHALLSYVFGTVIIAATINALASISH